MRKEKYRVLTLKDGKKQVVFVTGYSLNNGFFVHRDTVNPNAWRVSAILCGLCDGILYKTRKEAVTKISEKEWALKCAEAASKCPPISVYEIKN